MKKFRPYASYSDSGVPWIGKIPETWRTYPIRAVAVVRNGATPDSKNQDYWDGDIPWFTPSDLDFDVVTRLTYPKRYISAAGYRSCATNLSPPGSVIVSTRAPVGNIGITATESTTNQGCRTLTPKGGITPVFLASALMAARDELNLRSNGTTFVELSTDSIKSIKLPIPSQEEVEVISSFLDRETTRIDTLIAKKTRFIELLREKRQAVITKAVTKGLDDSVDLKDSGVAWIGMIPNDWVVGRLRDFCSSISTGPFGTALKSTDYVENGIPVINPSHMDKGRFAPDKLVTVSEKTADRLSFWKLRDGDLIAARRGELGRAAVVTSTEAGWICGTGSLRITPLKNVFSSAYLYMALQSNYARAWLDRESVGSTMPNLSESLIGRLPIVLPPTLGQQNQLLQDLDQIEQRIARIIIKTERSIELLKEHRAALITAAVTGKIDVREAA